MIKIDLPEDLEHELRAVVPDLETMCRTTLLVEMYRRGAISHGRLAEGLNTSRDRVDALLARFGVDEDLLTFDELAQQTDEIKRLLGA
ncbi:MAG: UPF0175 family protein [Phycisphaerae bacterium]